MQTYAIPRNIFLLDGLRRGQDYAVRDLPPERRPREKMLSQGPEALSVKELLAIVLGVDESREDILEMPSRLIRDYGEKNIFTERDAKKLGKEMGIAEDKACQIVAAGELGRRFYDRDQSSFATLRNAREVHEYLQDMRNLSKEHLRGLYLNSRNRVVRDEVISIGTINSNVIHPREVFRPAIESNAAAVILAHNHPSGETEPSWRTLK